VTLRGRLLAAFAYLLVLTVVFGLVNGWLIAYAEGSAWHEHRLRKGVRYGPLIAARIPLPA